MKDKMRAIAAGGLLALLAWGSVSCAAESRALGTTESATTARPTQPAATVSPTTAPQAAAPQAAGPGTQASNAAPQGQADASAVLQVETVAEGLVAPWALAFAPDGRIFLTERPGRVRVVVDGALRPEPAATISDVAPVGEGGLLGLALDPDFDRNRWV